MSLYRDPVASLSRDPIVFDLRGKRFTVPALDAAAWLTILFGDRLTLMDIIPGLLSDDEQDEVNLGVIDGDVAIEDLNAIAEDVLSVASGRDWWVTVRLVTIAKMNWDVIGGELGKLGLDWTVTPLGTWLDVAYSVMRTAIAEGGDSKTAQSRLTKFVNDLERSPADPSEELDEEAEAEAFMRAMQMAS
jgi:hypothetical protein